MSERPITYLNELYFSTEDPVILRFDAPAEKESSDSVISGIEQHHLGSERITDTAGISPSSTAAATLGLTSPSELTVGEESSSPESRKKES